MRISPGRLLLTFMGRQVGACVCLGLHFWRYPVPEQLTAAIGSSSLLSICSCQVVPATEGEDPASPPRMVSSRSDAASA